MTDISNLSRLDKKRDNLIAYSPKEIEKMLGISHSTLDKLFKTKKLKSFKIGRRRLVSEDSLLNFIVDSESEEVGDGI